MSEDGRQNLSSKIDAEAEASCEGSSSRVFMASV
jgi:hypothetical protein